MRALAVVTSGIYESSEEHNRYLLDIDGQKIPLALVQGNKPDFKGNKPEFSNHVLIKKISFSLNYRDLGVIEQAWKVLHDTKIETYYPVGSDFAGYVEEVGAQVANFKKGDLVIGDCAYPEAKSGVLAGIPSNHASREYEVYHQAKLILVPNGISGIEAGALSIGTQTANSMLRKAQLKQGDKVLVTSITSNTSFFFLNTLWDKGCEVYGLSYSGENIEIVQNYFPFIRKVFLFKKNDIPCDLFFDVVLDAFSDTYLTQLMPNLNMNARYVTCGIYNQSSKKLNEVKPVNLSLLMASLMMKNIQLIANCLGTTEDLEKGLQQFKSNTMVIDSIFSEKNSLSDFFERTYNHAHNKFGKVVFVYED